MSRTRYVKGNITKITHGNHNMYSGENIITKSKGRIFENGKQGGVVLGEPEEYIREGERVINIKSDLYIRNSQKLQTPYLDVYDILNFENSKPFIAGIRAIFGDDIKHTVAKEFMLDLLANKVPLPQWKAIWSLPDDQGGFYNEKNNTIYINEKILREAENNPEKSWLLFLIMIEETGHYVDYLLRNKYDTIGGDAPGDEGTIFAADFIHYNKLLYKDFEFAEIEIEATDGTKRIFKPKVLENNPEFKIKTHDLLYTENKDDDHGIVTLENGEQVEVEFFKIRGAGAIHEDITKRAATTAGVLYDYRLDEGAAWPDVPCEDQNSIETCYIDLGLTAKGISVNENSLVYKSHYGSLQYWHSMAPAGNKSHTIQEVKNLILKQAENWFKEGINVRYNEQKKRWYEKRIYINNKRLGPADGLNDGNDGLFHIGKILHMVQDSYSLSHTIRNDKNEIMQFQGYDEQDETKHGHPDRDAGAPGVTLAENASAEILKYYKEFKDGKITEIEALKKLENYLDTKVYPIASGRESIQAGGSLPQYKK